MNQQIFCTQIWKDSDKNECRGFKEFIVSESIKRTDGTMGAKADKFKAMSMIRANAIHNAKLFKKLARKENKFNKRVDF